MVFDIVAFFEVYILITVDLIFTQDAPQLVFGGFLQAYVEVGLTKHLFEMVV